VTHLHRWLTTPQWSLMRARPPGCTDSWASTHMAEQAAGSSGAALITLPSRCSSGVAASIWVP